MSTNSPDQLPTSSETPAHLSAPVESTRVHAEAPAVAAAGRSRSTLVRRLTIGGVAGLVVVALGLAGAGFAGAANARAAAEREQREYEERERAEYEAREESKRAMEEEARNADRPSVDVARYYEDLYDVQPNDITMMCLESFTPLVMQELVAVVDGSATTTAEYFIALEPFVICGHDSDDAVIAKARVAVSPSELDTGCAGSILVTLTREQRLDALVSSRMDPVAYDQWVHETFAGCAV